MGIRKTKDIDREHKDMAIENTRRDMDGHTKGREFGHWGGTEREN